MLKISTKATIQYLILVRWDAIQWYTYRSQGSRRFIGWGYRVEWYFESKVLGSNAVGILGKVIAAKGGSREIFIKAAACRIVSAFMVGTRIGFDDGIGAVWSDAGSP